MFSPDYRLRPWPPSNFQRSDQIHRSRRLRDAALGDHLEQGFLLAQRVFERADAVAGLRELLSLDPDVPLRELT
jgi:hypothetical protein